MAKSTTTTRERVSPQTEAKLLIACKRRCCLCYFWDENTDQHDGQIAHIDRDPANSNPDNLAYLCLRHHNEYDTKQQQGKSLTQGELRHAREKLYQHFNGGEAYIVTIRMNCDDDDDPQVAVDKLTELIKNVTNTHHVDVLNIRKGSILVTLRLSPQQLEGTFAELANPVFKELGVTGATIDSVEDGHRIADLSDLPERLARLAQRVEHHDAAYQAIMERVEMLIGHMADTESIRNLQQRITQLEAVTGTANEETDSPRPKRTHR